MITKPRLFPFLLLAGACATMPAAEYEYAGSMKNWNDPAAWNPQSVPGADATVRMTNGQPVFLTADATIADYVSPVPGSEQIIGRGGVHRLTITGTLRVNKDRGTARFRGHTGDQGADSLELRVGALHMQGAAGKLALGEYTEGQSDRALRLLEVSGATQIGGGAEVSVFTAPGVVARFGPVAIEAGGGALYLNNGSSAERAVHIEGLSGTPDAVVANSGAGGSFGRSVTRLELAPPEGTMAVFGGRLRDRDDATAQENRMNIEMSGGGIQVFSGHNDYSGDTVVKNGSLIVHGSQRGAGATTVMEGASIGGRGSLAGTLTLNKGARFYFHPAATLSVTRRVWLHAEFGVDHLLGLDSGVPAGRYTLIANELLRLGPYEIRNLSPDQAADIGGGKRAYFETGPGLVLVVE